MKLISLIKKWVEENKDKDSFVDDVWKGYNYLNKFQDTKEYKEKVSDIVTCIDEDCKCRFSYSKAKHDYEEETLREYHLDPISKRIKSFDVTYGTNYVICSCYGRRIPRALKESKKN